MDLIEGLIYTAMIATIVLVVLVIYLTIFGGNLALYLITSGLFVALSASGIWVTYYITPKNPASYKASGDKND